MSEIVIENIESIEEIGDALARNEEIIRKGLIDIGEAFKEIVKWKMYKAKGYQTWDAYCRGQWHLTDRYVRYIIKAADILQRIGTIVPISHLPEGVVREVVSLPNDEARIEVINKVLEANPNPTAKEMKRAVEDKLIEIAPTDKKTQKILERRNRTMASFNDWFTETWKKGKKEFSHLPLHEMKGRAIAIIQAN